MVLILSDNLDPSTNRVIDWLNYLNVKWMRINESDTIRIIHIEFDGNEVSTIRLLVNDRIEIDLTQIKSYWYRRGYINTKHYFREVVIINEPQIADQIKASLIDDERNIITFIHEYLNSCKVHINSYLTASNDKTAYLLKAGLCGLSIPDTIICDNKDELSAFFNKHEGKIICKSVNEGFSAKVDGFVYYNQTNLVSSSDVQNCHKSFFPSLFQKNIDKFIELRN